MAGRPRYEPTLADRNTVKNLAAAGVAKDRIAQCIGEYGVDKKTLYKHFRRELDVSKTQVTAMAMSKVVAAMTAGEAWAVCFWLKCREQWTEPQRTVLAGDAKAPIGVGIMDLTRMRETMLNAAQELPEDLKARIAAQLMAADNDGAAE